MRLVVTTFVALGLLLSGCIAVDDETPPPTAGAPEEAADIRVLPDPIKVEETIMASFDPLTWANMRLCATPGSQCRVFEFELNGTTELDATLTWMLPVNDFDLFLYLNREFVDSSADLPPENLEELHLELGPGSYLLVVAAWAVVADTFTLEATFT